MTFHCQLRQIAGVWTGDYAGPHLDPIRVRAASRDEALRKLEAEIYSTLGLGPSSGKPGLNLKIELKES